MVATAFAFTANAENISFDSAETGKTPPGWNATKTGSGAPRTRRSRPAYGIRCVVFTGNKFIVTFDRRKVIEATDNSFPDAGKVGVWTKADSMTLFDDFSYGAK